MRPLTILTTFNEIDYMPLKKRWCEANGLDLYVIDNFSNDGTAEWLWDSGIDFERVDTSGSFDLPLLQKATMRALHRLNPSWIVYIGADTFYVTAKKLKDYITEVDKKGFNVISFPWNNFYNTGEVMETFDPINTYFYYSTFRRVDFIMKYHPKLVIRADDIFGRPFKKFAGQIEAFNYGNTKPAEARLETLRRRQKAWKDGMNKDWGNHYKKAKQTNWLWEKKNLTDIRKDPKWKYIQKLQSDTAGTNI